MGFRAGLPAMRYLILGPVDAALRRASLGALLSRGQDLQRAKLCGGHTVDRATTNAVSPQSYK